MFREGDRTWDGLDILVDNAGVDRTPARCEAARDASARCWTSP
jgi:NADP-dependent 3-hydroxy acid dehydrogenase YdfG